MRRMLLTGAIGIIGWAAAVVPLPLVVLSPVAAKPVSSVIQVSDTTDEVSGQLLFTAVSLRSTTTVGTISAWRDPYREITLQRQVFPEDVDPSQFLEQQQELFAESLQVAAAMGLRAAGREVSIDGDGARVVALLPDAPAQGVLRPGDVIVSAGGQPVSLASELVTVVSQREAGEEIELVVRRDGERVRRSVTLGRLPGADQVGLGVLVDTRNRMISLPVDVTVEESSEIGGPSAGLMMALTVYDLVDPADLTDGRAVAGTGTMDTSGNVGAVGGVEQKVRGAELSGAEVFLVSEDQLAVAREAASEDLEVIGVATLDEAISALTGQGS